MKHPFAAQVNLLTGGPPATGADRASAALTGDPRVDFASFTGSGRGGRANPVTGCLPTAAESPWHSL